METIEKKVVRSEGLKRALLIAQSLPFEDISNGPGLDSNLPLENCPLKPVEKSVDYNTVALIAVLVVMIGIVAIDQYTKNKRSIKEKQRSTAMSSNLQDSYSFSG